MRILAHKTLQLLLCNRTTTHTYRYHLCTYFGILCIQNTQHTNAEAILCDPSAIPDCAAGAVRWMLVKYVVLYNDVCLGLVYFSRARNGNQFESRLTSSTCELSTLCSCSWLRVVIMVVTASEDMHSSLPFDCTRLYSTRARHRVGFSVENRR